MNNILIDCITVYSDSYFFSAHPPPAFGSSTDVEPTLEVNPLHAQDTQNGMTDIRLCSR
jgi:hypothetical protein